MVGSALQTRGQRRLNLFLTPSSFPSLWAPEGLSEDVSKVAPAGMVTGACRKSRAQVCDSSMNFSSPALSQGLSVLVCRVGFASDHSSGLVPGAWANRGWGGAQG